MHGEDASRVLRIRNDSFEDSSRSCSSESPCSDEFGMDVEGAAAVALDGLMIAEQEAAQTFSLSRAFPSAFFTCTRCQRTLSIRDPLARHSEACVAHAGSFLEYVRGQAGAHPGGPAQTIFAWECCGLADRNAPGCVRKAHLPGTQRALRPSVAKLGAWGGA